MTDSPEFVLCLYRATADVERMVAFLEAVGLHRTVRRDEDGTAFLWGRSGMVAVFDATAGDGRARVGETQLSFESPDLDEAAAGLAAAGTKLTIWDDEGARRVAGLQDPSGRGIFVRESMRDADDDGAAYEHHPIDVVAVRESTDVARDAAFFGALGFVKTFGDEHWTSLDSATDGGVIGLHAPWGDPAKSEALAAPAGSPALAHLGFQTAGDLDPIAARLQAAGFAVAQAGDGSLPAIEVADPDGVRIEIHRVG
ncbi:VOC family protein [Mariniluteicoccus flavus]